MPFIERLNRHAQAHTHTQIHAWYYENNQNDDRPRKYLSQQTKPRHRPKTKIMRQKWTCVCEWEKYEGGGSGGG